ncbi:polysaccharide pyruvyl transferase family protein [Spirosoma horti]
MNNTENILGLRKIIFENLDPIIDSDYCLLDIPDHKNIGDNLIWAGELNYLSRLPYKMLYTSNLHLFQKNKVKDGSLILLHGGGNFGDLWRIVQEFRNSIVNNFKKNKIIIFPQTVHYENDELLNHDAEIFNQHPDLTICARDSISFEFFKKHFAKNKILLVPDMAFCLDFENYQSKPATNKVLFLKRKDKELNKNSNKIYEILKHKSLQIDVKDWPPFNIGIAEEWVEQKLYSMQKRLAWLLLRLPLLDKLADSRYGLYKNKSWENYVSMGVSFINEYDEIYSTRLHTYILAILLNKKAHLIDNSYGKNSRLYNTWMKNFENSSLV